MKDHAFGLLQGLMETLSQGVAITDQNGRVLSINPAFSFITGYPEQEVLGRDLALIAPIGSAETPDTVLVKRRDGSLFPRRQTRRAIRNEQGTVTHHIALIAERGHHHHAKQRGHSSAAREQQRIAMAAELSAAMTKGELSLHYQPQVHWKKGTVVGAEALLRWQKADGSWIGPAEFIPVAEEFGLIVELGQWVLEQACHQRRCWNERDLPAFPIAVNCSALQFRQPDFIRRVTDTLAANHLAPEEIELEITESVLMSNHELAGKMLAEFKSAGVRIAMDDFGTGYSSLAYLRQFPVDQIKIDASFIRDLDRDATNRAIVRSIVALGRSLDIELVAEGVETDAIAKVASTLGCNYLQGYGLCRPAPAKQLEDWLANRVL